MPFPSIISIKKLNNFSESLHIFSRKILDNICSMTFEIKLTLDEFSLSRIIKDMI